MSSLIKFILQIQLIVLEATTMFESSESRAISIKLEIIIHVQKIIG